MNKSTQQVKLERVKGDPRAGREVAGDAGNKQVLRDGTLH